MTTAEEVITFIVESLEEMNLDVDGVSPDTMIGPAWTSTRWRWLSWRHALRTHMA